MTLNVNHESQTPWAWVDKLRSSIRLKRRQLSALVNLGQFSRSNAKTDRVRSRWLQSQRLHSLNYHSHSANDEGES